MSVLIVVGVIMNVTNVHRTGANNPLVAVGFSRLDLVNKLGAHLALQANYYVLHSSFLNAVQPRHHL